jgi:prevent-host-death family protein
MLAIGIRELKNNLSEHVRRVEKGERVAVTAHGRIVAELVPPGTSSRGRRRRSRYDELVAKGVIKPAKESGDPLAGWPRLNLKLPAGTAARWLDEDREEPY